tara:strand:- start:23735 stop:23932 length:198 start_codon:yes stop_codon:yes gene_type:complete
MKIPRSWKTTQTDYLLLIDEWVKLGRYDRAAAMINHIKSLGIELTYNEVVHCASIKLLASEDLNG